MDIRMNIPKLLRALLIITALLLTGDHVYSDSSAPGTKEHAPFIPGAVGYWPMTSESKGSDLSGYNNQANFVNLSYTDGPDGELRGGVHFNGRATSYAWMNMTPTLNLEKYDGFSFCGFLRTTANSNYHPIILWWDEQRSDTCLSIIIRSFSDYLGFSVYLYGPRSSLETRIKITAGSWQFLGVSYDKATGRFTTFMDGKQEVKQYNFVAGTATSKKVWFGVHPPDPRSGPYNGDMSCMMLFKVALTADDFERIRKFCLLKIKSTVLPNITVSDITSTRALASWTQSPGTFSGYNITIERKPSGLDQESVHLQFIPASVTYPRSVLTDLVPGAAYRVHVWHMQGDLVGRARSSAWFDTEPSLVVEPDSIVFSEITATSAKLSWRDVTGIYDSYTVDISPTTGGAKVDPSTVPRGTVATSLKNLSPRTYYTVRIRTKSGLKMTSPSSRSFQTPDPPELSPVMDSNSIKFSEITDSLIFSEITATSAKVSWKDVTGYYDGYSVDISPTTGGAKADPSIVPRGTTTTTLRNLSPSTYYTVRIRTNSGLKMTSPSSRSFQTPDLPRFPTFADIALIAAGVCLAVIVVLVACIVILFRRISHLSTSNGNASNLPMSNLRFQPEHETQFNGAYDCYEVPVQRNVVRGPSGSRQVQHQSEGDNNGAYGDYEDLVQRKLRDPTGSRQVQHQSEGDNNEEDYVYDVPDQLQG